MTIETNREKSRKFFRENSSIRPFYHKRFQTI